MLTPFGGDMNREKKTSQDMRISTNIFKELRYGKFVPEFLCTILLIYLFIYCEKYFIYLSMKRRMTNFKTTINVMRN